MKVGHAIRGNPEKGLVWWSKVDDIIDAKTEEEAQSALKDSGEFKTLDIMIAKALWILVKGEWVAILK